jgi:hypothetical protein
MRSSDDRARVRPGVMLQRQQTSACNAYEMSNFSRGAGAPQTELSGEDFQTLSAWHCKSLVSLPFRYNSMFSHAIVLRVSPSSQLQRRRSPERIDYYDCC